MQLRYIEYQEDQSGGRFFFLLALDFLCGDIVNQCPRFKSIGKDCRKVKTKKSLALKNQRKREAKGESTARQVSKSSGAVDWT